jgi:hypothetical protein
MGYPHPDFEWLSRLDRLARKISRGGGGKRFPGGQSTSQTPPLQLQLGRIPLHPRALSETRLAGSV